ncbi:hypothetical protein PFLA_b0308 [Pseudoalteromonas flavipulchra NCIMB 2033 = ATCC BAA-314]|nr:hypothetical protein [Pseudoalteromonas flavipulchra NCIMB 2033 = ATCC BAA-314]
MQLVFVNFRLLNLLFCRLYAMLFSVIENATKSLNLLESVEVLPFSLSLYQ